MSPLPKREFHCRTCARLLFRTNAPANDPSVIELTCPDRRCRRFNTYRLCDDDRPGDRRAFLAYWESTHPAAAAAAIARNGTSHARVQP